MKDESVGFGTVVHDFQAIAEGLMEAVETLSKKVESEKLKAIGSRNALKTIVKQQENERQQMQVVYFYISSL